MKQTNSGQRILERICKVLLVLSMAAIIASVNTMVATAQDKDPGVCADTSCWPNYEFICQHISSSCHCTGNNGTWCR